MTFTAPGAVARTYLIERKGLRTADLKRQFIENRLSQGSEDEQTASTFPLTFSYPPSLVLAETLQRDSRCPHHLLRSMSLAGTGSFFDGTGSFDRRPARRCPPAEFSALVGGGVIFCLSPS